MPNDHAITFGYLRSGMSENLASHGNLPPGRSVGTWRMRRAGGLTPRIRHELERVAGHAARFPAVTRFSRLLLAQKASTVSTDLTQVRDHGSNHSGASHSPDNRSHDNLAGAHAATHSTGVAT
ncbi:hypothetical protein HUW46_03585 [Amycolatopsis sp. CA-230715]|nr:hypothetical protein HUW46_03585 [Amycolatopsis sp. CA-230715]